MSVLSGSVYIAPQFWYKLIIVVAFGLPSAILLWRLLGSFIPQRKTRTAAIVGVTVFFVSFGLPIYIGDPNVLYFSQCSLVRSCTYCKVHRFHA